MHSKVRTAKLVLVAVAAAFCLFTAHALGSGFEGDDAAAKANKSKRSRKVRDLIIQRVGSTDALRVPPTDAELPQPRLADGSADPRYAITEAKRYLGKLLFFDPVRSSNIRPEFGGMMETSRTGSCGSCHLGEVAGRAGQVINLHLGGEGRGFTDVNGNFHVRRRIQPGVFDVIPTGIQQIVNGVILKDGRFDALDSVPRLSPSMIGFGFNTRLLLGGKAGEPSAESNPNGLPTAENLCEIAFDSHRMLGTQKDELQQSLVYIKLFEGAFPEEATTFHSSGNLDDLINDGTVERAVAAFLRSVVTRETPWDRFLAGDDGALTKTQLKGAQLFMTPASLGGADCISCHSGPMLNKQLGDEAGVLVEENFHNIGVGDHPLQHLAATALEDPNHHDLGRFDVTGNAEDYYEFRTPTLRQLKDSGGQLMHSALFGSVREVVEYFNAGVPQDAHAAAATTLSARFTRPRGPGQPAGLGLKPKEVDALVDFIENGLYDPAFATFDPNSATRAFELTERDLNYSVYHPELAALGAVDGLMPSGLCATSNDGLTRRDRGLDFLDVTPQAYVDLRNVISDPVGRTQLHMLRVTNIGSTPIDTHLLICFTDLPAGVQVLDAEGITQHQPFGSLQYTRQFLPEGQIDPGASYVFAVRLSTPSNATPEYSVRLLSGQGKP